MTQLYSYTGTVGIMESGKDGTASSVILSDIGDTSKPPVWLEPVGLMRKYIYDIEGTDAEERYIRSVWVYDRNLFIHCIEFPSSDPDIPAKVIAVNLESKVGEGYGELVIFGPQEYIETSKPGPMSREEYSAWLAWRLEHV